MPSLSSLNWDGFSRGEDSEGYAIDPLGIANGYASVMENLEPRAGRLRPRYGSSLKMTGNSNVTWMGEFQKEGSGYSLILDSHTLYGINIDYGNKFVIRENWNLDDAYISSCRVGKFLILCVDSLDQSMVVYEKNGILKWFGCFIGSGSPFSSFSSKLCDSFGNEVEDVSKYNGDSVGNFNVTEPRDVAFTYVKLEAQNEGADFSLLTGMPGALLESSESQDDRIKLDFQKWGKYSYSATITEASSTLGSDLVSGDSYNLSSGWSGDSGVGFKHVSGVFPLVGSTTFSVGKKYKAEVSVTGMTYGQFTINFGGVFYTITSAGDYSFFGVATKKDALSIDPSDGFVGTIKIKIYLQTTVYSCSIISNGSHEKDLFNGYKLTKESWSSDDSVFISSSEYSRTEGVSQIWDFIFDKFADLSVGDVASISQSGEVSYRTDGEGNLYLKISDSFVIPSEATHVRVYMTPSAPVTNGDFSSAQSIADGLYLRWVEDIPIYKITPGSILKITGTDGYLQGSSNLCWSTGRDNFPGGSSVVFGGGRLWVGPRSSGSNPGRWMASETMDGSSVQLAKALSFSYANDFIDTSTDDSETSIGGGISQGDLIVFNKRSVWRLENCDIDKTCVCISRTHGAIGAITEVNQQIYYLSVNGPAVVSGSVVELFTAMKSSRTSKALYGSSTFYAPGAKLRGIYHNDSWIVSDGTFNACFLMRGDSRGTWSLTNTAGMNLLCSCYPAKGVCWVGGKSADIYSLMEKGLVKDGDHPFKARLYTNATRAPKGMECAEAFAVLADLHWTDSGKVGIAIHGDYTRLQNIYDFVVDQREGMATDVDKVQYGPIMQGIRAGAMSHWFIVGIEKWILDSNTLFGPISLQLIPRNYHPETISLSEESSDSVITDSGFFGFDQDFMGE